MNAVIIVIIVLICLCLLIFSSRPMTTKLFGGNKRKILFIGTVPIKIDENAVDEEYKIVNGLRVWNAGHFKPDNKSSDAASNFKNVREFLEKHENDIEYNFLNGPEYLEKIDEKYKDKIIHYDLTTGLPEECIGKYDLVYIDTNTLGFIDAKRGRQWTKDEWVSFFKPLLKKDGCMIIDDNDVFGDGRGFGLGYNVYLAHSIYEGLTKRLYVPNTQFTFKNEILSDFMNMVVRHRKENIILIPVPNDLMNVNPMNKKFTNFQKEWDWQ